MQALKLRGFCFPFTVAFLAAVVLSASATIRYVSVKSLIPMSPYTNWASAATNIQDAVEVADTGDDIIVTNGFYVTGGRKADFRAKTFNRVAVTKALTVRSVNGPTVTTICGKQISGSYDSGRCVYLTNGAALIGFTLTNGVTTPGFSTGNEAIQEHSGGGVWSTSFNTIVSNCIIVGNSASVHGGGAYSGTLNNCTLSGNKSEYDGGGAYYAVLNNCTLTNNSALGGGGARFGTLNNCVLSANTVSYYGGGTDSATLNNCTVTGNSAASGGGGAQLGSLNNCIVYYNTAAAGPNCASNTLHYCCTSPMPVGGYGNFTSAPLFVDSAHGNFRLQPASPCLNAGGNDFVSNTTDRDGYPRIMGGKVDVGAYESQSTGSGIPYIWLQQYCLAPDGSADYADPDQDGFNNFQEWRAGNDPTNATSVLRMLASTRTASAVTVSWASVTNRSYWLERSTNLSRVPKFSVARSKISGQAGSTTYIDTNAPSSGPLFYRVGVNP